MDHHNISLITTLASGFGLALLFGFIAERVKIPALVGYLVAGIALGPATPGFNADIEIAAQLSEIGVMLLMFGVGLHFSLGDLLAVRRIAVPGAVAQMSLAAVLGAALSHWGWGWDVGQAIVFGLCLSCASTVVLLKALEARGEVDTQNGRIAVGWLVVEDLATVLVLVLLPPLAFVLKNPSNGISLSLDAMLAIGGTLISVAAFIVIMFVVGRKVIPWMLWQISRTGSRELFTLSVIAAAISIAWGAAEIFQVSFALGAFVAGMVMRESKFSHRAAEESLPLRDAFSVLFFVSVGMLFDPAILLSEPLEVLGVVAIIILGKGAVATALVLAFRHTLKTALTVSASLAQIGEFSFILAGVGVSVGLMTQEGMSLILAGALISIALNPFVFRAIMPLQGWLLKRSSFLRKLETREEPFAELPHSTDERYLSGQVILVGFGRVGRRIHKALVDRDIPVVVVEANRERVEDLRRNEHAAVYGDAAEPEVLVQAHIHTASMLVVATPDLINVRQMMDTITKVNPGMEIVLRTHSDDEADFVRNEKLGTVFNGEAELANGMTNHIISRFAPQTSDKTPDQALGQSSGQTPDKPTPQPA